MREEKEQKIAEIREALSQSIKFEEIDHFKEKAHIQTAKAHSYITKDRHEIIGFLLSELELKEKENQKLREEQEFAKREAIRWNSEASNFKEERNYYKEIYRHEKNISTYEIKRLEQVIEQQKWLLKREGESIEQLQQREQKLIEGLRWYGDKRNYHNRQIFAGYYTDVNEDEGQRARDILTEIGVTME